MAHLPGGISSERLIVALDQPVPQAAVLAQNLMRGAGVRFFKLRARTFLQPGGYGLATGLLAEGAHLMLDLKSWDNPTSVAADVLDAFNLGAWFVTVRAEDAVVAAAEGAFTQVFGCNYSGPCRVLPVGNLTSDPATANVVSRYIGTCEGAVMPGSDLRRFRKQHPHACLVVPGVRPAGVPWSAAQTQADDHDPAFGIVTPGEAIRAGADYLVVGRPIYRSLTPEAAALTIIEEIARAAA